MGVWTWLTGVDPAEEQRRSDDADRRLREMNLADLQRGTWSDEEFYARDARITAGALDVKADYSAAFKEGLDEGYQNTTGAIRTTLASPFNFAFASIPWQVWLALGVFVAWKTGLLRKMLKTR